MTQTSLSPIPIKITIPPIDFNSKSNRTNRISRRFSTKFSTKTSSIHHQINPSNSNMGIEQAPPSDRSLVFTYGTLKRGFANHTLMQDLIRAGDAAFVGASRTAESYPLVCGPYRVPFLLNFPGSGHAVHGELYAVSARGLARLDELEGTTRGHYVRSPIKVQLVGGGEEEIKCADAYYAHGSYATELWKRNGERGHVAYSEKEARGYVRRKDRPQNLTFLDHIQFFISSTDH